MSFRASKHSRITSFRASVVVTVAAGAVGCGPEAHQADEGEVSVNPPPVAPDSCPDRMPEQGTPCELPADEVCGLEPACFGPEGWEARCIDGEWTAEPIAISCNPPPILDPECPASEMAVDGDCLPILDECPESAPVNGAPCATEPGLNCWGGDSCDGDEWRATCEGNRWELDQGFISSCNPPPPLPEEECPQAQPGQGTECWTWDAVTCHYLDGQFTGDAFFDWDPPPTDNIPVSDTTVSCDDRTWQVQVLPDDADES